MNQEGKTLMELLVIVTVVGIVASLGVPDFLTLHSRTASKCALDEIAAELRLARQLAMTHRDRVRVVFDLEQQAMTAQFANGAAAHHVYRYGEKGIVIEEPSAGPEILFHPSGRTATATTIHLRGKNGEIRTLTVSMTGRVSHS